MHTIIILKTNQPMLYPVPCAKRNRQGHANATFLFSFLQFSPRLEAQSPQLLSKEDIFPVGRGGGQQRQHSIATLESTVPGTRFIVTSCPPATSCWWRDKSPPSLTSACRESGHDEITQLKGDDLCPYSRTRVIVRRGPGIDSHIGRQIRDGHLKGPGPNRT